MEQEGLGRNRTEGIRQRNPRISPEFSKLTERGGEWGWGKMPSIGGIRANEGDVFASLLNAQSARRPGFSGKRITPRVQAPLGFLGNRNEKGGII
jgi:hypothetical protein